MGAPSVNATKELQSNERVVRLPLFRRLRGISPNRSNLVCRHHHAATTAASNINNNKMMNSVSEHFACASASLTSLVSSASSSARSSLRLSQQAGLTLLQTIPASVLVAAARPNNSSSGKKRVRFARTVAGGFAGVVNGGGRSIAPPTVRQVPRAPDDQAEKDALWWSREELISIKLRNMRDANEREEVINYLADSHKLYRRMVTIPFGKQQQQREDEGENDQDDDTPNPAASAAASSSGSSNDDGIESIIATTTATAQQEGTAPPLTADEEAVTTATKSDVGGQPIINYDLSLGLDRGYRGIERWCGPEAKNRQLNCTLVNQSIVLEYRSLARSSDQKKQQQGTDNDDCHCENDDDDIAERLRRHSMRLTRYSRSLASLNGEADALVVQFDE